MNKLKQILELFFCFTMHPVYSRVSRGYEVSKLKPLDLLLLLIRLRIIGNTA